MAVANGRVCDHHFAWLTYVARPSMGGVMISGPEGRWWGRDIGMDQVSAWYTYPDFEEIGDPFMKVWLCLVAIDEGK